MTMCGVDCVALRRGLALMGVQLPHLRMFLSLCPSMVGDTHPRFVSPTDGPVPCVPVSGAGQSLARMMNNGGFAGMMVMLLDGVHRVGSRGAALVNTGHGAVADRAAIVPGHGGTRRYCLE